MDEVPKDKKKTSGGKRKRSSTVDTKSPKRAKKTEDTEKVCEQNSFEIIGGETEKYLAFVLDRGKCNEMSNADMIKRNLIIINKNVCAIAQFFECQKSGWISSTWRKLMRSNSVRHASNTVHPSTY